LTDLTVDEFLDSAGVAFRNAGQIVPWPMHVAHIAPFYSDLEAADLVWRLSCLRASGTGPAGIAALYPSASSAKSLMLDLIPGMKDAGVPADVRLDFVSTVFAGLAERERGDVFCRDGAHRLLTGTQASALTSTAEWTPAAGAAGRDLAKAAFTLSGAAQSLVWSMHFYGWTDISFVIHGPYQVTGPDGHPAALVVRDFFDLESDELWPELPEPPCRDIRLCTLHDDSDAFSIDIFNHLLHRHPLLASTTWISLSVDGGPAHRVADLAALSRALVNIVRRQKTVIDALDRQEVATKFVESRYYAFRRWRSATGDRWRPPPEVYQRLRDLPVAADPVDDPPWQALRDIFDPRLDWPGPA
jgi:hypothetical protein